MQSSSACSVVNGLNYKPLIFADYTDMMKICLLLTLIIVLSASVFAVPVKKTMKPFKSEQELTRYLRELSEKYKQKEVNGFLAQFSLGATVDPSSPLQTEES